MHHIMKQDLHFFTRLQPPAESTPVVRLTVSPVAPPEVLRGWAPAHACELVGEPRRRGEKEWKRRKRGKDKTYHKDI